MSIISIVVPVYKVEKLLERCVKSLIDQSLEDIEIILVDDGSPDKSGDICDKLKQQDSRICIPAFLALLNVLFIRVMVD